jgi:hypothetical protein
MIIEQTPYRQRRQSPERNFLRATSKLAVLGFVAFNWLATQRAAAVMDYAPFLGGRLIAHIYQPFAWLWWQHRWSNNALRLGTHIVFLAPVWRSCEHVVIYPMLVLSGIAGLCAFFLMTPQQAADLHGSAAWANNQEIIKAGLL